VVCQLDVLRKCLKVETLRNTLRSLPESLDETYVRILLSIDKLHRGDAYKVLQWLAFSARPVTLAEVAEALTADLDNCCLMGPDQQLGDPQDILTICSTLVTTSNSSQLDGNIVKNTGMFSH
jgi:ankyrin repeat domain-containing protein 50